MVLSQEPATGMVVSEGFMQNRPGYSLLFFLVVQVAQPGYFILYIHFWSLYTIRTTSCTLCSISDRGGGGSESGSWGSPPRPFPSLSFCPHKEGLWWLLQTQK